MSGVRVLAHSMRKVKCCRPLVVMVSDGVSESSRLLLQSSGCEVVSVRSLVNPFKTHVQQWADVGFTKLRMWQLEQFSKVVYIDADCIMIENCDELFELETDFAAAPDVFPPDKFNAGVVVLRPSNTVFEKMVKSMSYLGSHDGGDTGFLNSFFPQWFEGGKETRLGFGYNALRILQWFTKKQPGYWKAVKPLKIVHFCSSPKPWEDALLRRGGQVEELWWSVHDDMMASPFSSSSSSSTPSLSSSTLPFLSSSSSSSSSASSSSLSTPSPAFSPTEPMRFVSFERSMGRRARRKGFWHADEQTWLGLVKKRYEEARVSPLAPDNRIPLLIHQIWLGGPVPSRFDRFRASWQQHNPLWRYRLWTDADLAGFPHSISLAPLLTALMDNASSPVERSDILRLDLLYAYGGLYVDTDFECLRPFHELTLGCDFFAGLASTAAFEANNGLMGSAPSHPLIAFCVSTMALSDSPVPSPMEVISRTGPGHLTRCLIEFSTSFSPSASFSSLPLILPPTYFFPLPNNMRALDIIDRSIFIAPESFAVHHWDCSWQKATEPTAAKLEASSSKTSGNATRTAMTALDFSKVMAIVQANQAKT